MNKRILMIISVILAVIGAVALLGALGMWLMPEMMMGGMMGSRGR
jgi:multisubunit Na+/H+ antiporter MnhG subunit